jgi:hypothetical protein
MRRHASAECFYYVQIDECARAAVTVLWDSGIVETNGIGATVTTGDNIRLNKLMGN